MTQLLQKERKLYSEIFLDSDKNGDGYLNMEELRALCKTLGFNLDKDRIYRLFNDLDKDANKRVTLDEFLAAMPAIEPRKRLSARMRRLFQSLDKNEDKKISPEELSGVLQSDGVPLSTTEINDLISEVDRNGDGKLDYEEFLELLNKKQ
ncbi:16 kDa calcium-binding protein-like [Haliotis rufescens]|uniref:16 kDa calcium-binding protein-like n=1 Tax=Haliotis rufescens TaxID=6454 RepID=UPI00201F08BC|nr:16 kDa calcium-binding protein-like [Haliotis rufescens]